MSTISLSDLRPGTAVEYDQRQNNGGFDWQTFPASIVKVGTRRVKIAFAGREAWVTPGRVRLADGASR